MHSEPSPPGHAGEKLATKRHFDQEVLWKCYRHGKCFRPGLSLKHHGNRLVPCAWHGDFSSLFRRFHQRSAAFACHCSYGRDRADYRGLPTDQRQDGVDCGFEAQRKVSNGGDTPKRPWVAISCHSSSHCKSSVVMWCYMMLTMLQYDNDDCDDIRWYMITSWHFVFYFKQLGNFKYFQYCFQRRMCIALVASQQWWNTCWSLAGSMAIVWPIAAQRVEDG